MPASPVTDHEQIASRIAQALTRHGWREIAIILLDTGQPLTFVAGQLFYIAQPALALFWPYERLTQLGNFLEDPDAVPRVLANLEAE
jgi:hypothetical protein